jgi:hypothetical protein
MADTTNDPFGGRQPPPELEMRVVKSLRGAGYLEPAAIRFRRRASGPVALAAALVLGFFAGRLQAVPFTRAESQPTFLLLLYEDASYRDDRPTREIVAEYAAWADSLRREGKLVLGEKLTEAHINVPPAKDVGAVHQVPTGMFVIRARGIDAATTVAETAPHVRYGGRILVTAIEGRTAAALPDRKAGLVARTGHEP